MKRLCGIDGCKYGWFALFCAENFSNIEWQLVRNWTDLDLHDTIVAVDMPIGLAEQGRRGCEEAARKDLGAKSSSLFPMPARTALEMDNYAAANAWSKANGHGGIVKQAWNLKSKILQVEAAALQLTAHSLHESHPELCFARVSVEPLAPKRTMPGKSQRLNILSEHGIFGLEPIIAQTLRKHVAIDDILDAAILLLTAKRIVNGSAQRYPARPLRNHMGLEMAIWV